MTGPCGRSGIDELYLWHVVAKESPGVWRPTVASWPGSLKLLCEFEEEDISRPDKLYSNEKDEK